ncbi:DUF3332 domain-containing protein [Prevotella sp. E9-3]|uniref:DUF3332 domain-containing protein n=1 Tax=Prevotella sp. E9-3 TaxID=2913621 RepID=UPI001EDC780A|nr:DUF3332 domain-containing protein [Prevotella sp. E9-3]UKK48498.1 DUF3332 domain-containing protein [Prevotella sp. E9-3]
MKKINLSVAAVLLAASFIYSSCIGSYALFNKYEKWQTHMTSNKYVNGIVGLLIEWLVAPICLFVDSLVLNTIEFWSGNNPLADNTQTVMGQDGRYYVVKTSRQGYEIKAPTGEVTYFLHDEATDSWSMKQNGVVKEIFRFNPDGTIQATMKNGEKINVTNDQAGLDMVRAEVMSTVNFFAAR